MNRLLINTANDELFIVLQKDNKTFSTSINSRMHHNETMLPEIDKLLNEHKMSISDIKEFGVVIGPGSFTGIRVGISTIKAFRDALNTVAKSINNLDYLFALARQEDDKIETVAINGSRDSYFVGKFINGIFYKYERNLSLKELLDVAEAKPIGMFKEDENLNCKVVNQNAEMLIKCYEESVDQTLVPVYYQLSQAENEKLKRCVVNVELACLEDVDAVTQLEQENISVNAMSKKQIENAFKDDSYIVFKAVLDADIVGFIMLQKTDELNIDSIVVNKTFRNLGIATKLISKAGEYAREIGVNCLSLEVSKINVAAFLLYKKLGFVERRVRKSYYADGSDAIEMVKEVKKEL